jgi:hypothetical protein
MIFKPKFLTCLLLLCCCEVVVAQDKPKGENQAQMYKNIEQYSRKENLPPFCTSLFLSR